MKIPKRVLTAVTDRLVPFNLPCAHHTNTQKLVDDTYIHKQALAHNYILGMWARRIQAHKTLEPQQQSATHGRTYNNA